MENEEVRELVQRAIRKTERQIADYESMAAPVSPDDAIGRVSRMDAINNKSVVEAALRNARDKLDKLKYMEAGIGADDFGVCKKCRQIIPVQRILIRPESIYCVHCAE
jgi:DnaK suppressor protein